VAGIANGGKLPKLWECIGRPDRIAAGRLWGGAGRPRLGVSWNLQIVYFCVLPF